MKLSAFFTLSAFGLKSILHLSDRQILGTIILTDRCNLSCRHCAVNNITSEMYPYEQIRCEMEELFRSGVRILFFCGGETFLWEHSGRTLRDLVREAKAMGFLIVNVVTNGTFPLVLPEADLILLSLDGGKEHHNAIRGDTYDAILENIRRCESRNICLYMAINQINKEDIATVCQTAKEERGVRAVSFNFHTPYPGTEALSLSKKEKVDCCAMIARQMKNGAPVFNLKSAFPYLCENSFPTPCRQCVVVENGKHSLCGRCVDIPGLCESCGYFFAAEYALVFRGNLPVIADMLCTYLRYI